jgi:hypothetical protein
MAKVIKFFTVVIYRHSMIITVIILFKTQNASIAVNYCGKKFYNIYHNGLHYKTFYGRNLRIFL